jgi:glycosyltransferase involved in cell wall biosynthesis
MTTSRGTALYLSLQRSFEGQASFAHVHRIIEGLSSLGWQVELHESKIRAKDSGVLARLTAAVAAQTRLLRRISAADVIYIRWHELALPAVLAARLLRVPVVQEVNSTTDDLYLSYAWTRMLKVFIDPIAIAGLRLATVNVTVTPGLAEWLRDVAPHVPALVIPNGADPILFHPAVLPPAQRPYVAFVGALSLWQGIDTLIAAARSSEWPAGVDLLIAGDGAARERVLEAVTSGHVIYRGVVPHKDVPALLAGSLAGISPQNERRRATHGVFPLKVFETLACGLPAIVSDIPGQAEMIAEGQCGLVVPPGDPVALATAVAWIAAHEADRVAMGRRGRELVVARHSWKKRAHDTDAAIELALRSHRSHRRRSRRNGHAAQDTSESLT